jgi:hypothetical protein
MLVERLLPGLQFIDRQLVAAADLFERNQPTANRGNNLGFAVGHPAFRSWFGKIDHLQVRSLGPNAGACPSRARTATYREIVAAAEFEASTCAALDYTQFA